MTLAASLSSTQYPGKEHRVQPNMLPIGRPVTVVSTVLTHLCGQRVKELRWIRCVNITNLLEWMAYVIHKQKVHSSNPVSVKESALITHGLVKCFFSEWTFTLPRIRLYLPWGNIRDFKQERSFNEHGI